MQAAHDNSEELKLPCGGATNIFYPFDDLNLIGSVALKSRFPPRTAQNPSKSGTGMSVWSTTDRERVYNPRMSRKRPRSVCGRAGCASSTRGEE